LCPMLILGIQKTKATLIRATNFFSFHNAMRSALCPMRYPLGPTTDPKVTNLSATLKTIPILLKPK
ncbi:MAG: hypothetical protein PVH35_09280, partial [Syntrophobacterales bacterium]